MQFVRNHLDYLQNEISQVDAVIDTMVEKREGLFLNIFSFAIF